MVDRSSEWFVPNFGPDRFRRLMGLLFLPYTGMVLSFSVVGGMLADPVHWDRVVATVIIYSWDWESAPMAVSGLSWSISFTVGPYFAGLILDSANPNLLWALCGVIGLLAAVGFTFLNRVHGGAPALEAAAAD